MEKSHDQNTISSVQTLQLAISHDICVLVFEQNTFKLCSFSKNTGDFLPKVPEIGTQLSNIFVTENSHFLNQDNGFSLVYLLNGAKSFDAICTHDKHFIYFVISQQLSRRDSSLLFNKLLEINKQLSDPTDKGELISVFLESTQQLTKSDYLAILEFDEIYNWQVIGSNQQHQRYGFEQMHFPSSDWPTFLHKMLKNGIPYFGNFTEDSTNDISFNGSSQFSPSAIPVAAVDNYTQQLWENMGYKSIALFPILKNQRLWGVLLAMHTSTLSLKMQEVATLAQVAIAFGERLQTPEKEPKAKSNTQTLYTLFEKLSKSADIDAAIEHNTKILLELFRASGMTLFKENHFTNYGTTPPDFMLKEIKEKLLYDLETPLFKTSNLAKDLNNLQSFKGYASGLLAAKLGTSNKDFLVWYRPNQTQVIQWAGNPHNKNKKDEPRKKFDPWIEVRTSDSLKWTPQDSFFAKELANYFGNIILTQEKNERDKFKAFKLLFEDASELIMLLLEDFSIKHWSKSVKTTLGITLKSNSSNWLALIHPDDRENLIRFLNAIKNGKNNIQAISFQIENSSGTYIHLECYASNQIANPLFGGILCNLRNVNANVHTLNRLTKFQHIIENTNSAVLLIDTKRKAFPIVYVNNGIQSFTNLSREAVVGRTWLLIDQYILDTVNASIFRRALKERKDLETTLKMHQERGEEIWVRAQISLLEANQDRQGKVVVILSDITGEVKAKEKLKEYSDKLHLSNEELQTFAYVASHDLQEPLRTISGFSELFAEIYQDKIDQEANEYLDFILQATGRMKKLINDLLHFSRLSTEKGFIKEVNVATILEKSIDNLHTLIEENKAIISHDLLPNIFVNETLLLQVFQNLISNAIKYRSEEQPRIHITAKHKKQEWIFGVEDNGIGISEKYYERIFIIFQRLHTSDKYTGTGIGLAICKKIIEKYGGKIWLQSEEGKGSVFYFSIPDVLTLS